MILHPPMKISARLLPAVQIGDSWVSLEFQHRRTLDGRVQADFYIDTDGWTYEGEDLCSGVGANPTAAKMMETLLAFLGSAAEEYQYHEMGGRPRDDEDDPPFPAHVMEWAYLNEDEIEMIRLDLENQEEVEE